MNTLKFMNTAAISKIVLDTMVTNYSPKVKALGIFSGVLSIKAVNNPENKNLQIASIFVSTLSSSIMFKQSLSRNTLGKDVLQNVTTTAISLGVGFLIHH